MGIKRIIAKAATKGADKIAKLSSLSPEQLEKLEILHDAYISEQPDPNDENSTVLTERLLAASSIDIYNAYLPQLKSLYTPVEVNAEYQGKSFNAEYNIRYFQITKWVTDKDEKSIEKLVNVYETLADEDCNIALVFHRECKKTDVYLAVVNVDNAMINTEADGFASRLLGSIKGNFPGSECSETKSGVIPFMRDIDKCSVATVSNVPAVKSKDFKSQTIEKLIDGIVPARSDEEYTVVLLATPEHGTEKRKLHLADLYSSLAPYSTWSTGFTYTQSDSINSSATFGVNAGISAGVQNANNHSDTKSRGNTDSKNRIESNQESTNTSENESNSQSNGSTTTKTNGTSSSQGSNASDSVGLDGGLEHGLRAGFNTSHVAGQSTTDTVSQSLSEAASKIKTISKGISKGKTIGNSVSNALGKAATTTAAATEGISKGVNLGANFGADFARSSNVTATIGKNENIQQSFTNYTVKHTLQVLEEQMKRLDECDALGTWNFAAYVLGEDDTVVSNVAHSYLALTQGEKSYVSQSAINVWKHMGEDSKDIETICGYLKELRHPLFGIDPMLVLNGGKMGEDLLVYPVSVTAGTSLSGKELAYSLNFPSRSISGLPVMQCAEFGRNIVTFSTEKKDEKTMPIGRVFHMNQEENTSVSLNANSLSSHLFITGSTGSGKSNTIYKLLSDAEDNRIGFLVVEPAKGEYKQIFGMKKDVHVYGTNPDITPLLKLNPFSFPKDIHVLEHLDRLIEIFNVCWPMYAAMPAVLKSAAEKSYEDCGWNLKTSKNEYGDDLYPSFADLARNVAKIIDSSEYDSENKGAYKGSLITRLHSLTDGINGMIFSNDEISEKDLFDGKTIIDLSRVGSTETKSLLMGIIVLKLQEYRMSNGGMNSSLKHLTVLEEAHNLLKRSDSAMSLDGGNLAGKSVEMLSNAIAEMRTYGEGFIIADQAPGLLDRSVIRNTNTKIIMRLPDQDDRELVGKSANLNEQQITEIARLPLGVAAVYQNEWVQPILCKIDHYINNESLYIYEPVENMKPRFESEQRIKITELLINSTSVSKENIMHDILPELRKMPLTSYEMIRIVNLLIDPSEEPRMTKLSSSLASMFPEVKIAVVKTYHDSSSTSDLTKAAEQALKDNMNIEAGKRIRHDIIQGVITDCLLYQMKDIEKMNEWYNRGGYFS